MNLTKITLLLGAMALVGCSASSDNPAETTGPLSDDPSTGSITVSANPAPVLEPLPEVEFTGVSSTGADAGSTTGADAGSTTGGADAGSLASESMLDGGVTSTDDFTPSSGSSDTGGSTDGGSGTTDSSTGGRVEGTSTDTSDGAIAPEHSDPWPEQFRAGTLTAADYDDQLNPHLYQSYASEYLQRVGGKLDVPYLDLSNRIAVNVTGPNGLEYAGTKLFFTDNGIAFLSLTIPASGTTYLYTDIDALPEQFNIRAVGPFGGSIEQTISLSQAYASGAINITMPDVQSTTPVDPQPTMLDIMFVVDTTGSMGDELNYLQTELTPIINAIPYDMHLLNIGLTFYRDIGDEYVVRAHGFTNDIGRAQQTLNNESYDGGGDYPEAMDQALHQAVDANWSQNSTRIVFLIADAPPHGNKMRATWQAAKQARLKNIHIVPIAASGVGEDAEYLMRSMAAYTNSRYLFLTDDSGFGNPHAEPDIDCYVVTHLDNLMERVLNSLITGQRDEPSDNEIIRRVGDYDQGKCRTGQTGQQ